MRTRTRTRLGWQLAGVALALALVATACGDDDDDSGATATTASGTTGAAGGASTTTGATGGAATATTAAAKPGCTATVPGTQINMGLYIATAALDPAQVLGSYFGGTEVAALYDVLMRYDFDQGKYVPQAAESMTSNTDFTAWTLKLRPNMKFSNGDPFDVDALFAHLDRFAEPGVRNSSISQLRLIKTREKVDAATAKFTLVKPWSSFPYVFANEPGEVVNTKVIGADPKAFNINPPNAAGIGPYVLERFAPGEELVLKARTDYWGGPVCVERARFVPVLGAQATYDAYKAGDINVATLKEAVMAQAKKDGEAALDELQDTYQNELFNLHPGAVTANPKIRQAAALALDEKAINQRAYLGGLNTSRSFINPDSPWYTKEMKTVPGPDVEKAKQLVAELKASGFDGKIRVGTTDTPPLPDEGIAVKAMLDAVGFNATVETYGGAELFTRIVQGDFEFAIHGWAAGEADAPFSLAQNLRSDSPSNRSGENNPAMDAALDELLAAPNHEAGLAAMTKVNDILTVDLPAAPLGASSIGIIHKPDVKGIKQNEKIVFLFDKAYIQK